MRVLNAGILLVATGLCSGPFPLFSQEKAGAVAHPVSAGSQHSSATRFAAVRKRVAKVAGTDSLPSISVAVASRGRIVWEEAFGWADRQRKIPATPSTRYGIASISKPITATALMVLVKRGKVDLGKPAQTYLPGTRITGYAADPGECTVRRLLQHRCGIPFEGQFFYEDEPVRRPPVDETIRRYGIIVEPPGERYRYTNLGYGILERIIESVSGLSFKDFLTREVFQPLALSHTSVGVVPGKTARLYLADGTGVPFYDHEQHGSGYVFSTARDLVKFGMFHMGQHIAGQRSILTNESILQMQYDNRSSGSATGFYGLDWFYGLGWGGREKSQYGPRWFGHEGGMPGSAGILRIFPDQGVVIVVLANTKAYNLAELTKDIAEALIPDYREQRIADPTERGKPTAPAFVPEPGLTGVWQGELKTWISTLPVYMTIVPTGEVRVRIGQQPEVVMTNAAFQNGWLTGRCDLRLPTPDSERERHDVALMMRWHGGNFAGTATATARTAREHFFLPFWVKLNKSGAQDAAQAER